MSKTFEQHSKARTQGGVRDAEERVYNAIIEAILDHQLVPGTKLVELELAEILGVSRGAVRGALSRLEHDLLVDIRPNRGAVIASPSAEEGYNIFEARRVIEAATVQKAAETMTPARLKQLRDFLSKEKDAYVRGDLCNAQRLSRQFHIVLAELADNQVLKGFLEHLICRQPLLVLGPRGSQSQYCGAHEHELVIDALADGDTPKATTCMMDHLNKLENQLSLGAREPSRSLAVAIGAAGSKDNRGNNKVGPDEGNSADKLTLSMRFQ